MSILSLLFWIDTLTGAWDVVAAVTVPSWGVLPDTGSNAANTLFFPGETSMTADQLS